MKYLDIQSFPMSHRWRISTTFFIHWFIGTVHLSWRKLRNIEELLAFHWLSHASMRRWFIIFRNDEWGLPQQTRYITFVIFTYFYVTCLLGRNEKNCVWSGFYIDIRKSLRSAHAATLWWELHEFSPFLKPTTHVWNCMWPTWARRTWPTDLLKSEQNAQASVPMTVRTLCERFVDFFCTVI